jgi:hypothetical protein
MAEGARRARLETEAVDVRSRHRVAMRPYLSISNRLIWPRCSNSRPPLGHVNGHRKSGVKLASGGANALGGGGALPR